MTADVGYILKPQNSTRTSSFMVTGQLTNMRLKDPTSVMNPVFVVAQDISSTLFDK